MAISSCLLYRTALEMVSARECSFKIARYLSSWTKADLAKKWTHERPCCLNTAGAQQHYTSSQSIVNQQQCHSHHHHHHHHHKPHSCCTRGTSFAHVHDRCLPSSCLSTAMFPFSQCCRLARQYSTSQGGSPKFSNSSLNPHELVSEEMALVASEIRKELYTEELQLKTMSHYYFDGKGKTFRPLVAILMAKTCNVHNNLGNRVIGFQTTVAMIAEMIHTASLVHDDVIDASNTRRGQPSLNKQYGQRLPIMVGDFILSRATIALARTGNTQVIYALSSIIEDLVSGEFMQLGSKENENERFSHYLKKTYLKTASLLANICKSTAILAEGDEEMVEMAFQYGRNLGIAFQLIDDLLDFVSCESVMGKPTAADLKLGLATAPVLFAAQEFPELHPMIMRRFSEADDVEEARALVAKSSGVEQTRLLAAQHSKEAIRNMEYFTSCDAQQALIQLATVLLDRKK